MTRLRRIYDRMCAQAADMMESAYRCQDREPERAEMLRDMARRKALDAAALLVALDDMQGPIDDPRQMELHA